jgi:hypothetical protein
MVLEQPDTMLKNIYLNINLKLYTKITLKSALRLNTKNKSTKLLEENKRKFFFTVGLAKIIREAKENYHKR